MNKELLLSFYFGSLEESSRLEMERRMLTDPVLLLDYLDLKRELEAAATIAATPSPVVWKRIQAHLPHSRRARFTWALGIAAIAAAILFFAMPQKSRTESNVLGKGILFDSGREQFDHSNVL